ncbi:proteasome assembly chaperone 2 [Striga asiatica]|uniref:Proteasome assembly chaperone 2 n=1 Tax=Striga asiatica TaxID=4170 RepID=A0A5A7Q2G1_STRAF|nr:proteasome assembly chaperone 2 [Striga asiatica]
MKVCRLFKLALEKASVRVDVIEGRLNNNHMEKEKIDRRKIRPLLFLSVIVQINRHDETGERPSIQARLEEGPSEGDEVGSLQNISKERIDDLDAASYENKALNSGYLNDGGRFCSNGNSGFLRAWHEEDEYKEEIESYSSTARYSQRQRRQAIKLLRYRCSIRCFFPLDLVPSFPSQRP